MPRPPVTSDWQVVRAIVQLQELSKRIKPKPSKSRTKPNNKAKTHFQSGAIAHHMKLSVFQVTARLKAMQGRNLLERDEHGNWSVTAEGQELANKSEPPPPPPPSVRGFGHVPPLSNLPDDSKVPTISKMGKTQGWDWRSGWGPGEDHVEVYISPSGQEYVQAHPLEKAHLIRIYPDIPGLSPMRLVKLEGSVAMQHMKKKKKATKQGKQEKEERRRKRLRDEAKRKGQLDEDESWKRDFPGEALPHVQEEWKEADKKKSRKKIKVAKKAPVHSTKRKTEPKQWKKRAKKAPKKARRRK
jgi:hypothetical protein